MNNQYEATLSKVDLILRNIKKLCELSNQSYLRGYLYKKILEKDVKYRIDDGKILKINPNNMTKEEQKYIFETIEEHRMLLDMFQYYPLTNYAISYNKEEAEYLGSQLKEELEKLGFINPIIKVEKIQTYTIQRIIHDNGHEDINVYPGKNDETYAFWLDLVW
jgi:hypothetical protein